MKRWLYTAWAFLLSMITACAAPPDNVQQTLIAEHDAAGTELAIQAATATIASARLRTTLDFAGTQVGFARDQGELLRSTLIARGTDSAVIDAFLEGVQVDTLPTATPRPPDTPPLVQPSPNAGGPTLSDPQNADSPQPRLSNPIFTDGVGDNGCALSVNPTFTPQSEAIYIVVTAQNIPAGTQIASRWRQGEQEIAFYDYVPPADIASECVWFFIDQTDAIFSAGSWSVALELDGQPVGTPIPFTIEEGGN